MRYLVVGAAGLVGSHVQQALGRREVVATYRSLAIPGGLTLDVRDKAAVRSLVRAADPDVIVLAAAAAFVEECERDPAGTRLINIGGAAAFAEEAERKGAFLAVFSSEYVFATCASSGCAEDDEPSPINEYGRQKVEVEKLARTVRRHLICRTSSVFGQEERRRNFVLQLVDGLRAGRRFAVPDDQVITPTYAPSLARALVELIEAGHTGTFHIAGPRILTRLEFAEMVIAAFKLPAGLLEPRLTSDLGLAAPRPLTAALSTEKLRGMLGWRLADPADGLAEMARAETA